MFWDSGINVTQLTMYTTPTRITYDSAGATRISPQGRSKNDTFFHNKIKYKILN